MISSSLSQTSPCAIELTDVVISPLSVVATSTELVSLPQDVIPVASSSSAPPTPTPTPTQRLLKFILANYLPLGFGLALIIALSAPGPGKAVLAPTVKGLHMHIVQTLNIVCVFVLSGLTLDTKTCTEVKDVKAAAFGVAAILVLTPLLGLVVVNIPTHPREIAVGAALFCCTPTTLGVGVALTAAAGGNSSLALFLTIVTNSLGVFIEPSLIQFVLSFAKPDDASDVIEFNPAPVLIKMTVTVLLPTIFGLGINLASATVRAWVSRHRLQLSLFSHTNLIVIVWQTLSSASSELLEQSAASVVTVIFLSSSLHVFLLLAVYAVTSKYCLALPVRERIAIVIMASQKSAPVAITLIFYITANTKQQALLAIPALIGQLAQIFIGSLLTTRFQRLVAADQQQQ